MHRKPYQKLALGGTFDHFHIGHQHFIDFAANLSEQIVIGLTTTDLVKRKEYADQIEDFHTRKRSLINYCKQKNYQCQIVPLNDPYGPPIDPQENFQGLAVTEFTIKGAKAINDLRLKLGLRDLPVHVCNMLKDATGQVISSTRIRSGEISRDGQIYLSLFSQSFHVSDNMKAFFSRPQGEIVDSVKRRNFTAIVGDTTLKHALSNEDKFDLAVFDGKEHRKEIALPIPQNKINLRAVNPAGQITQDLVEKLTLIIKNHQQYLFVDGEEDLATVALVLILAPGSTIYYGQPNKGIVKLKVTTQIKDRFFHILNSD